MSVLLQSSNVQYAVIQLSSTKDSPERLVLGYLNEKTLRALIAGPSIVGIGFSSRDEAVTAAGTDLIKPTVPRRANGSARSHADEAQVRSLRDRLANRMTFLPFSRLASRIVQRGIAAATFVFYSESIVSATIRAVLAGSM